MDTEDNQVMNSLNRSSLLYTLPCPNRQLHPQFIARISYNTQVVDLIILMLDLPTRHITKHCSGAYCTYSPILMPYYKKANSLTLPGWSLSLF